MKEAVDDIMVTLNEAASEVGLVGGMVDAIAEAMSKVGLGRWCSPSLLDPVSSSLPLGLGPQVLFSKELSVKADTKKTPLFLRVLINVQMSYHMSNILFILYYSFITFVSQMHPSFQFNTGQKMKMRR